MQLVYWLKFLSCKYKR